MGTEEICHPLPYANRKFPSITFPNAGTEQREISTNKKARSRDHVNVTGRIRRSKDTQRDLPRFRDGVYQYPQFELAADSPSNPFN